MEVVSQIVGPVVKTLMCVITKHVGYLTSSTKQVRYMKDRMKHLEGTSADIKKKMDLNIISRLVVPDRVPGWLEDVELVKKDVKSISSNGRMGCFKIKRRHRVAREAIEATEKIESLIKEKSEIHWSDAPITLGKVDPKPSSTSTQSSGGDNECTRFKSRSVTFNHSLKLLQQDDHKTQVIALCGMGGVGKTTMMEQLKKVAHDKSMFNWILKITIGRDPNMLSIQNDIAAYTGKALPETTGEVRADILCDRLKEMSQEGKKKILLILDDVWEKVELKLIGLTGPLPNGFKLLLTSRFEDICRDTVDANWGLSVVGVNVLAEAEAKSLFSQITEVSEDNDPSLYKIGCDIVKRCGGLPFAIKIIAKTLKSREKFAWERALDQLKKNNLDKNVEEIIVISYNYLETEMDRAILLLCGLFPEDFNVPIEDLTRYAWGLRLFEASTLREARNETSTCVTNLKNANLLIDCDGDYSGCVKMHDLVLAFVLARVSKGKDAWIIDHGDMLDWSKVKMSKSCKRISLACNGRSAFPCDFKFPNLSVLKLMKGDKSLRFPDDFYEEIKKLQMIAIEEMKYPSLPPSFQCSTNLVTLCLHECSLMFDLSSIGNLLNLEVLSFANSGISKLPSTIGNLKKLRLLDLTGCINLVIDDGVLINLVEITELYMKIQDKRKKIKFTINNYKELAELSKKLSALEIELFDENVQPRSIFFENLERFKISVGCSLGEMDKKKHSYENTLKLVTNRDELVESRMNVLFEKTEVLHLEVDGMIDLEDVDVKSLRPSFYNLRVLVISDCAELGYLFTLNVAKSLSKLEDLEIKYCTGIETVIHVESNEVEKITFPKLKSIQLRNLETLLGLSNFENVIELPELVRLELMGLPEITCIFPKNKLATSSMSSVFAVQTLFNEQVAIPRLEELKIEKMENLKKIWGCEFSSEEVNVCMLRVIKVEGCDGLVNVFPTNPMSLLPNLQEITVNECGSIEVLFDIDMDCVGEIEKGSSSNMLKEIWLVRLQKLREIWRVKGGGVNNSRIISGFEALEFIGVDICERFRDVFTPITFNFDFKSLKEIYVMMYGLPTQEISNEEISEFQDHNINCGFWHNFRSLHSLSLSQFRGKVVFQIDNRRGRELRMSQNTQQPLLLPYLKDLHLRDLNRITHVWKCSTWNEFLILQKQHQQPSFHNLTDIWLSYCKSIKYLFSPLMAELLSKLKNIRVNHCDSIEEIISIRDDEEIFPSTHRSTNLFPHLDSLTLECLENLRHIGGGRVTVGSNDVSFNNITTTSQVEFSQVDVVYWSLCQYFRKIRINYCYSLSNVIPSCALEHMHKLQVLEIGNCNSMTEVFESQGMSNKSDRGSSTIIDERSRADTSLSTPRLYYVPQLSHLKNVSIWNCPSLQHVFMFSALKSLRQLEQLKVDGCTTLKVIVKEENGGHTKDVGFPRLKSIELVNLPNLLGFFMGINDFQWPSLEKVVIDECPQIKKFTHGCSSAPKLNFMHTGLGKHNLECGLNFYVNISHQTTQPSSSNSSSCSHTLEEIPWSFHNLIDVDITIPFYSNYRRIIFPSNELLQLQKLEKIHLRCECWIPVPRHIEEVFEPFNGTHTGLSESHTVVKLPKLSVVDLVSLGTLKYIWKSNRWTTFEFPNLTRLSITKCDKLKHVFTCSMIGNLLKLQDLRICGCKHLEVIVNKEEEEDEDEEEEEEEEEDEDEDEDEEEEEVELPCLKSLQLEDLSRLKGFSSGKESLSLPKLDTLEIMRCPKVTFFSKGHSTSAQLKVIDTSFGRHYVRVDLNSFIKDMTQQGYKF